MQDESKYPANVKVELAKLRDASNKILDFLKASNSQNPSISSEIADFDIKNATIVDENTGQVVNPGTLTRKKANTTTNIKNSVEKNKYWIIGGVVIVVIVILGVVYLIKKRRS